MLVCITSAMEFIFVLKYYVIFGLSHVVTCCDAWHVGAMFIIMIFMAFTNGGSQLALRDSTRPFHCQARNL